MVNADGEKKKMQIYSIHSSVQQMDKLLLTGMTIYSGTIKTRTLLSNSSRTPCHAVFSVKYKKIIFPEDGIVN